MMIKLCYTVDHATCPGQIIFATMLTRDLFAVGLVNPLVEFYYPLQNHQLNCHKNTTVEQPNSFSVGTLPRNPLGEFTTFLRLRIVGWRLGGTPFPRCPPLDGFGVSFYRRLAFQHLHLSLPIVPILRNNQRLEVSQGHQT